jgi:hypothetical protein
MRKSAVVQRGKTGSPNSVRDANRVELFEPNESTIPGIECPDNGNGFIHAVIQRWGQPFEVCQFEAGARRQSHDIH